jgi:hypothetical protein
MSDEPSVPSDDLTLTIRIRRPNEEDPDGHISLTTDSAEDGVIGKHSDQTMKRVLLDVHSYIENGRRSWVNLAKPAQDRGRSL